jgi:hypothetical protein
LVVDRRRHWFSSSLCIGFWGAKGHKLGASLCLSHSSLLLLLFPCVWWVQSFGQFQTWEILCLLSLSSLYSVVPFSLSLSPVPLDWSMEKGKAGRS